MVWFGHKEHDTRQCIMVVVGVIQVTYAQDNDKEWSEKKEAA